MTVIVSPAVPNPARIRPTKWVFLWRPKFWVEFSLDGEYHSFPFRVDLSEPRDIRGGYYLPHHSPRRDRFSALQQPRLRSLFRCAIGVRCLPVPSSRRVHRILFLAAGASGSRDPTVDCSPPADASFVLAELAAPV